MTEKPKQEYKITPQEIHVKFCVADRVVMRNGQPVYEKWVYEQKNFPCGACNKIEDVKFMSLPLGVYRTCEFDGFTEKVDPVNADTGEELAYLDERKVITIDEAWNVLERNKSTRFPPQGLPKRSKRKNREAPKVPTVE